MTLLHRSCSSVFSPCQLIHLTPTSHGSFSYSCLQTLASSSTTYLKQEKTRQTQAAVAFPSLLMNNLYWGGGRGDGLSWILHSATGILQQTPHHPREAMGSHETGRSSTRFAATAALFQDPWGEEVEGKAGTCEELPGFIWLPRNVQNIEGKGPTLSSKIMPRIYGPDKALESCLTDSSNQREKMCPTSPCWLCGNTVQHGVRRQLAEGSKADTFFAFLGYSGKPNLTRCRWAWG